MGFSERERLCIRFMTAWLHSFVLERSLRNFTLNVALLVKKLNTVPLLVPDQTRRNLINHKHLNSFDYKSLLSFHFLLLARHLNVSAVLRFDKGYQNWPLKVKDLSLSPTELLSVHFKALNSYCMMPSDSFVSDYFCLEGYETSPIFHGESHATQNISHGSVVPLRSEVTAPHLEQAWDVTKWRIIQPQIISHWATLHLNIEFKILDSIKITHCSSVFPALLQV